MHFNVFKEQKISRQSNFKCDKFWRHLFFQTRTSIIIKFSKQYRTHQPSFDFTCNHILLDFSSTHFNCGSKFNQFILYASGSWFEAHIQSDVNNECIEIIWSFKCCQLSYFVNFSRYYCSILDSVSSLQFLTWLFSTKPNI